MKNDCDNTFLRRGSIISLILELPFLFKMIVCDFPEGPRLTRILGLGKTVLHETHVSGTVLWFPTNANSLTFTYISQNRGSGNRVSDFRVSGGKWKELEETHQKPSMSVEL